MAGTIIADFIRTDANQLSLNVGNTTFATINASGFFSNTGTQLIAANGKVSGASVIASSIPTAAIADSAITRAKMGYAGAVLQVVQVNYSTATSTSGTSYVATGMSASITPSSTSNKVMVLAQYQIGSTSSFWSYSTIYRNGTTNLATTGSGNPAGNYNNNSTDYHIPTFCAFLDSPASTSSVTYGLYIKSSNSGSVTRCHVDGMPSTLILLEIAG